LSWLRYLNYIFVLTNCSWCGENGYVVSPNLEKYSDLERSLVIDNLEQRFENDDNIGIAYIYFDYKNQGSQTTMTILASLLKQLAVRIDDIVPELHSFYNKFRLRRTQPDSFQLLEMFLHLSNHCFTTTFVIFDALDEFDESHRPVLLDMMKQFKSVRIFSTCRPHLRDVQDFFEGAATIPVSADTADIRNYLTKKVTERMSAKSHGNLRTKIVERLSASAHGL
jgi:hypothetical protein